jgi:hypothetical protein
MKLMRFNKILLGLLFFGFIAGSGLIFKNWPRLVEIAPEYLGAFTESVLNPGPETISKVETDSQPPLADPPEIIKAVYCTSWCAGSPSRVNYIVNLIKETELNAVVIDIKDYSGYVAYDIKNPDVEKYKAKEIRIPRIRELIKRLHDEGIYIIARQTVFQDPILAKARPDLAVKTSSGKLWLDNLKLAWLDPSSEEVWDYNIAIAKDALDRGFDEVNFDYIRFPSDGNLRDMVFPFYDDVTPKEEILAGFFAKLREETKDRIISADLFGLTSVNYDDLGIGQVIESAYLNFDFVCPMMYPSHYAAGFLGYQNPAEFPGEVVEYSVASAARRENILRENQTEAKIGKLRPWLQDFDLGAEYNASMVRSEIDAAEMNGASGWLLWNAGNWYTKEALKAEPVKTVDLN